jgi:phytoene dehydrogenase-like protein
LIAKRETDADVIVIGSGMGGLAAAAALARVWKKRVLVVERHWTAGGFTHSFRRPGGYSWDVGLHYIGGLGKDEFFRRVFAFLSRDELRWTLMPEPFERFLYPDFEFAVPAGREALRRALHEAFPGERRNIDRYLRDRRRAARGLALLSALGSANPLARLFGRPALVTTSAGLARRIRDPRLRALLVSRWGNYGVPPHESAFGIEGIISEHYVDGGYYPEGGAGSIAAGILPTIEEAGGRVLLSTAVREILVEKGRAAGVRAVTSKGEELSLRAPIVISDAGARTTYLGLLAPEHGGVLREAIAGLPLAASAVTLYLGLRSSAETIGLHGENLWIFREYDHESAAPKMEHVLEGRPRGCYASFATLNDPASQVHTAQVITFVDHASFEQWSQLPWRDRGAEYEALKERITDGLIDLVEEKRPGFRDLIAYRELSTPLSIETFTGQVGGQVYGLAATPERFRLRGLGVKTPVKGLFLTGADAGLFGVVGSMMSGLFAASAAIGGPAMLKLMREIHRGR